MNSARDEESVEPVEADAAEVTLGPEGITVIHKDAEHTERAEDVLSSDEEEDDEVAGQRNTTVFRGRVVGEEPLGLAAAPTPLRVARWVALGLAVAGSVGACGGGAEVLLLSLAGLSTSFVTVLATIVVVSLLVVWLQAWLVDRAARRRSSKHWFWSVALCWLTVLGLVASVIAGWVTIPAAAGGLLVNAVLLGCLQFHRATRRYLGEDL